jgi:quercetin dioxygenase-like cupin family protein
MKPLLKPMRPGNAPKEKYPWGDIHWLASDVSNGAKELTFGVTTVKAGGSNPLHRHPNCEEVLYVVSGEVEHFIEGTRRVKMKAGDSILIPRNRIHQAVNKGMGPAMLAVSFSSAKRKTVLVG